MSSDQALVLDGVFYDVGGVSILQGVYLRLERGQICGLFGGNGSGKSTILKVAAGQINPTFGRLLVDSEIYTSASLRSRFRRISYLPQASMLPPSAFVWQVLATRPKLQLLREDPILSNVLNTRIKHLSGGVERYLELQFVLSLDRSYVLLDEPFSGIAPRVIENMCAAIRAAADRGCGVIICDHAHHTLLPLVDDAYCVHQKQCKHLDVSSDLSAQLQMYGYFPSKKRNTVECVRG